jgi:hypothetical protein
LKRKQQITLLKKKKETGSCSFWFVLFLVRVIFGSCSFCFVPFLVCAVVYFRSKVLQQPVLKNKAYTQSPLIRLTAKCPALEVLKNSSNLEARRFLILQAFFQKRAGILLRRLCEPLRLLETQFNTQE